MGSRQAERMSVSVLCVWWALQIVIAHQHRGGRGTGPAFSASLWVFYTLRQRKKGQLKLQESAEESLSPLVPCKAFQFACLLLSLFSLLFMPQLLLAMLTNYCITKLASERCRTARVTTRTLYRQGHYVAKPEYMNNSNLNTPTVAWDVFFFGFCLTVDIIN